MPYCLAFKAAVRLGRICYVIIIIIIIIITTIIIRASNNNNNNNKRASNNNNNNNNNNTNTNTNTTTTTTNNSNNVVSSNLVRKRARQPLRTRAYNKVDDENQLIQNLKFHVINLQLNKFIKYEVTV